MTLLACTPLILELFSGPHMIWLVILPSLILYFLLRKANFLNIGISLVVFGLAFIIVSQAVKFTRVEENPLFSYNVEDNNVKNAILFSGVFLFIIGGLCVAKGAKKNESKIKSTPPINQSKVDDLLKLKDLLDKGAIAQNEFEAEKKKLLS